MIWRKSSRSNANGGQCVEVGIWHKSSLSGNGQDCVEAVDSPQAEIRADTDRLFLVRDSKDSDGPVLAFAPSEWADFLSVIKGGGFDGLIVRPKA
ncbi:DUF397 domain-containing protein [Streptosporangium sp. NPDC051023]|uniref:DUF397 domain-containing protein n=1 Tax=Streptosporangium sp. NPDC051023 TaxID=3155410 RepID=UPI00344C9EEA